jgi:hypothetical protein
MAWASKERFRAKRRKWDNAVSGHRPFGVTAIALLQAVNAAAVILEVSVGRSDHFGWRGSSVSLLGTGNLLGLIGLVNAFGLWRLQRWAWVTTMLWVGFVLIVALLAYFDGRPSYPVMTLGVLQVLYLNQSRVQAVFRGRFAQRKMTQ